MASHTPMDRSARWSALLDAVSDSGRLTVAEAAARLNVSEATVRRDFRELAEQQLVTRTHGGVVASAVAYDLPARYRVDAHTDAKERIARAAAAMLPVGAVVGFNGGRTTSMTARQLATRQDLATTRRRPAMTVVTNALNIASELVLRPYVRTMVLGGLARPSSYELTGPLASMVLDELWLDVMVLGVDGFSVPEGLTTRHEGEAGINAQFVRRSERVIVVAGSEKLGLRTLSRICTIDEVDMLVTDSTVDQKVVAEIRAAGVDVHIA